MPTNHVQTYSEQSKNTYSIPSTGQKQRAHNSFTTPDVKHNVFDPPVNILKS
jgi:hypothetical protein